MHTSVAGRPGNSERIPGTRMQDLAGDLGSASYVASASDLANGMVAFDYTVSSGQSSTDLKITGP